MNNNKKMCKNINIQCNEARKELWFLMRKRKMRNELMKNGGPYVSIHTVFYRHIPGLPQTLELGRWTEVDHRLLRGTVRYDYRSVWSRLRGKDTIATGVQSVNLIMLHSKSGNKKWAEMILCICRVLLYELFDLPGTLGDWMIISDTWGQVRLDRLLGPALVFCFLLVPFTCDATGAN